MNEQIWKPVVIVIGFLVGVTVVLRLMANKSRRAYENMQRLAARLNLTIKKVKPVLGIYEEPEMSGEIRGKQVRLYSYETDGQSKIKWAALSVTPSVSGGLRFSLVRRGITSKVWSALDSKEFKIGDEEFDRVWSIETNAPDFLTTALLPEIRQKIQPHEGKWELAKGVVTYAERGSFSNPERCTRFLAITEAACDLADAAEVYAKQS